MYIIVQIDKERKSGTHHPYVIDIPANRKRKTVTSTAKESLYIPSTPTHSAAVRHIHVEL